MRWKVLYEKDREFPSMAPPTRWSLTPYYMVDEGEKRNFWIVRLHHLHQKDLGGHVLRGLDRVALHDEADAGGEAQGPRHKEPWESCGLINRDEYLAGDALPIYQCNKCGETAPPVMIRAKLNRKADLKGTDPLNRRRDAVEATRNRHKKGS